jgi:hypothetical protein
VLAGLALCGAARFFGRLGEIFWTNQFVRKPAFGGLFCIAITFILNGF